MLNVSKAIMALRFPSGKAKKAGRDHGSDPAIVRQNVPAPLILVGLIPGA